MSATKGTANHILLKIVQSYQTDKKKPWESNVKPSWWLESERRPLRFVKFAGTECAVNYDEKKQTVLGAWKIVKKYDAYPSQVHWAEFGKGEIGVASMRNWFYLLKNREQHEIFLKNIKNCGNYWYYAATPLLPEEKQRIEEFLNEKAKQPVQPVPVQLKPKEGKIQFFKIDIENSDDGNSGKGKLVCAVQVDDHGNPLQVLGRVMFHSHHGFVEVLEKDWAEKARGLAYDRKTYRFFILEGHAEHLAFKKMGEAKHYNYARLRGMDEEQSMDVLKALKETGI